MKMCLFLSLVKVLAVGQFKISFVFITCIPLNIWQQFLLCLLSSGSALASLPARDGASHVLACTQLLLGVRLVSLVWTLLIQCGTDRKFSNKVPEGVVGESSWWCESVVTSAESPGQDSKWESFKMDRVAVASSEECRLVTVQCDDWCEANWSLFSYDIPSGLLFSPPSFKLEIILSGNAYLDSREPRKLWTRVSVCLPIWQLPHTLVSAGLRWHGWEYCLRVAHRHGLLRLPSSKP